MPLRSTLSIAALIALAPQLAGAQAAIPQSPAPVAAHPGADAPTAADLALRALYEREWAWRQQEFAQEKIDGRWQASSRLPSVAAEDWERRVAYWTQVLAELDAIDVAQL